MQRCGTVAKWITATERNGKHAQETFSRVMLSVIVVVRIAQYLMESY